MRNGTELPLIGLVLIAALALLFGAWSSNQVNLAAAQVGITSLGSQSPELAGGAVAVASWIVNVGGGVLAVAALCFLAWLGWSFLQKRPNQKWKAGPNAQWQGGPRTRPLSTDEVMRAYMLRQMMAGQGGQPVPPVQIIGEADDAQIQL